MTDISRVQDGFIATLFGAENGYEQIAAKRVIDTRTREFMDCRKVFGLMLAGEKDVNVWSDDKSFVEHGVFDDEYILHLYVDRVHDPGLREIRGRMAEDQPEPYRKSEGRRDNACFRLSLRGAGQGKNGTG